MFTTLGALMGFFLLPGISAIRPTPMAPVPAVIPSYSVTLTAYNAVPEQTDDDPLVTASGIYSNPDIIAARSKNLKDDLPFGTIIEIEGPSDPQNNCGYDVVESIIGYRIIADAMNPRYTDRIDILFSVHDNYTMKDGKTKNAGNVLGICTDVTIRTVGFVDLTKTSRIPKTQAELAALVTGGTNSLALK